MDPGAWIALAVAAVLVGVSAWITGLAISRPVQPWTLASGHPIFPWTRQVTWTFDPDVIDPAFRRVLALDWEWPWPTKWVDPVAEMELVLAIEDAWADYFAWNHWRYPFIYCHECGGNGNHLGTCSRSAMNDPEHPFHG